MTESHVLPADPREQVRDRYRALECGDRSFGDPRVAPAPEPRRSLFWIGVGASGFAVACAVACVWTVLT